MIKFRKDENCYYISTKNNKFGIRDWVIFYWGLNFNIGYEICGYFDNRPRINLNLFIFSLTVILPFRNEWTDECDGPRWGISIHSNTLWLYQGGKGNMEGNKSWAWNIPFITKEWIRTSILLSDNNWEHETNKNRKSFYENEWKNKQKSWDYNYIDSYDNKVIKTKIYVEEREWRPKWIKWTSLFAKTNKTIDIHFSEQCGKRKGSWKGGVLGCSYKLLPKETPLQCLKRMESCRKF